MNDKQKTYILFPSHAHGLSLEKQLKEHQINYTIVPTPRQLSTSCGISIMIDPCCKENVENILKENKNIETLGMHTIEVKKRKWFSD